MLIDSDLGNDPSFLKDMAQSLEGAGFDAVLTNDHVIGAHPDRQRPGEKVHTYDVPCHEPLVLLTFLGAVTTRLELVTSIIISTQRQTVLLAKQAAELDLLTGGRLRLGVGIGRNWMEYEALNEDFSNRGRRLEEQVAVLRALWSEELVTFDGQWHHLDRVGLNPLPVQRPIPIWMGSFVGALVEKVLERTGRLADGWMPQFPPGDELAAAIERLRGYAQTAGRDPETLGIECGMRISAADDPQRWLDTASAFRSLGATHLRVSTMGGGYTSPAEHLAAWIRWHDTVARVARN
jgi:probable F420-dependent oxidoreductase